jgi:PAS domain S-box-containing protein
MSAAFTGSEFHMDPQFMHNGLLEHISDPVVVINPSGKISSLNPSAEQLFMRPAACLVDQQPNFSMPNQENERIQIQRADQSKIFVNASIFSNQQADGQEKIIFLKPEKPIFSNPDDKQPVFWEFNLHQKKLVFSKGGEKLFSCITETHPKLFYWWQKIHPQDQAILKNHLAMILNKLMDKTECEMRLCTQESWRNFNLYITSWINTEQQITIINGIISEKTVKRHHLETTAFVPYRQTLSPGDQIENSSTTITESHDNPYVFFNKNQSLVFCNEQFLLLGANLNHLITKGMPFETFKKIVLQNNIQINAKEILSGKSIKLRTSFEDEGEKTEHYEVIFTPMQIEYEIIGFTMTFHNITNFVKTENKLKASEERLELALLGADLGSYDLDFQTRTAIRNRRWYEMLGYDNTEVENPFIFWDEIIHPEDFPKIKQILNEKISAENPFFEFEYRLRTKNGDWVWVLDRGKFFKNKNGGDYLRAVGTHLDITDRKNREREKEAILAVSTALRNASNRAQMLPAILEETKKLLDADTVMILLIDEHTHTLRIAKAMGECANFTGYEFDAIDHPSAKPLITGEVFMVSNLHIEIPQLSSLFPSSINAFVGAPLISENKAIGVLWAGRKKNWYQSEVKILQAISDMSANAIHRVSLHEETERRLNFLQSLHTIDRAITGNLSLSNTYHLILSQLIENLGASAANIRLYDQTADTLILAAGTGFNSPNSQKCCLVNSTAMMNMNWTINSCSNLYDQKPLLPIYLENENFQSYYGVLLRSRGQLLGILEIFSEVELYPDAIWIDFLKSTARQTAIAIADAQMLEKMQIANLALETAYDATIEGWSKTLELRDFETAGHCQRVTALTVALAKKLQISGDELVNLRRGAVLHDIGKLGVPDQILLKPGPLDAEEWALMKKHPVYAKQILESIDFLKPALDIPYYHHEKWDGSGYPEKLSGKQIPLPARIFAIVDVWDALTSDRPYRKAWNHQRAWEYISANVGIQFDPEIYTAFKEIIALNK